MKIFKNYIAVVIVLLSAGCEKSLDLTPKDEVSDASFWQTPAHFKLAANDFYFSLQPAHNYTDITSDIAFGAGANAVSNGTYLATPNSEVWNDAYTGIRGVNYLLEKAEESPLGDEIDRWVGEALFFRAYYYWKLTKTFGGVPLITEALDVNSDKLYTPRSTQEECIDFILADLENAIAMLPPQSELAPEEMGRVTKGAALALKARVALYQGTWEKYHDAGDGQPYLDQAIAAAEQVIASGEYTLYNANGDDSYKYLFIEEGDDSREVILARRYFLNRATHNWTRELWFNFMIPTKNLADMYLATDGRPIEQSPLFQGYDEMTSEFQNRDPRMAMTFIVPGSQIFADGGQWATTYPGFLGTNATRTGYMIRKFLGETLEATQFQGYYDFKEFRYAEILLILAEALYERDGQISDADLDRTINVVRARVNMPPLTNNHVTTYNLNMLEEIRRERTVELAFEGFRRDDLRRWKTAEDVMPQAIRGVKFVGTEYETRYPDLQVGSDIQVDAGGFIIAEPASSRQFLPKHYLNPLPLQQIQLSDGTLDQNTGW
ncbi:MAG TPA: RagB/SusD family nutrient uptake outer membrane protein [Chryseosolibacter sp.]|nr:RagB/SusD family nutrient uptake outer membrane protein [Chryseosolibacter sp.]